jgi:cysteine-rich repeat protein
MIENGEACDDGNTVSGDGCTGCILEPNCSADACETVCGDGIVVADAGEECDDGNVSSFDGCDPQCHIEAGFVCTTTPSGDVPDTAAPIAGDPLPLSECTSVCGDGIEVADEQCDDGSANGPGYGSCSSECTLGPRCGDGIVDTEFEQCDDRLNITAYTPLPDACGPGCVLPRFCGDGIVQPEYGEQCDAGDGGNTGEYGNCAPGCAFGPRCGDGTVQPDYEECDDGNSIRGDGCGVACRAENLPDDSPSPDGPVVAPTDDVFIPDAPAPDDPSERPAPNPCR